MLREIHRSDYKLAKKTASQISRAIRKVIKKHDIGTGNGNVSYSDRSYDSRFSVCGHTPYCDSVTFGRDLLEILESEGFEQDVIDVLSIEDIPEQAGNGITVTCWIVYDSSTRPETASPRYVAEQNLQQSIENNNISLDQLTKDLLEYLNIRQIKELSEYYNLS